jgi:lipoprotein-anchoring transpeptidase ErfK/SrfK
VRRTGSILCIAACALVACGSVAHADATPTTIADGVTIGTVDVSGLTAWQAKVAVKQAYLAPLAVRVKHHVFSVKPVHFRTSLPVDDAVQTALTAPADTVVPLTPTFSKFRVHKWVKNLAAKTYRAPVAGSILIHLGHPRLFHDHRGHSLKVRATQHLMGNAIQTGNRTTIVAPLTVLHAPDVKPRMAIVVIHRGSNRLVLFHGEHYVRAFPVATGQPIYPTPTGSFKIIVMERNPWWYPPPDAPWAKGAKPIPPGPGNPLGTRWMGLSAPGVGIHGTPDPASLGYSASHGCIRMFIPSAEWLFNHVQVGTPVMIVPA